MEVDGRRKNWILIAAGIGVLLVAAALLMLLRAPKVSTPDLYLSSIERRAAAHRQLIDSYLRAAYLREIPQERQIKYRIEWSGSHGQPKSRAPIESVCGIGLGKTSGEPPGEPSVRVVLWLDARGVIRHAVVCYRAPGNPDRAAAVVPLVRRAMGRHCGVLLDSPVAPDASSYGREPLYDGDYWLRKGRLRHGDYVSVSPQATLFVIETRMVDVPRPPVFFYWFADDDGRILARGMTGS